MKASQANVAEKRRQIFRQAPIDMVHFWTIRNAMKTSKSSSLREVVAIKREISGNLRFRLKQKGVTVASLARDTGTSRTAIRRVLDGKNTSITLYTIVRTANSLGYRVRLIMEPRIDKIERIQTPKEVEPLMRALGQALDRLPAR